MQIFISLFRQLKFETLTLFHLISATNDLKRRQRSTYRKSIVETERIPSKYHVNNPTWGYGISIMIGITIRMD